MITNWQLLTYPSLENIDQARKQCHQAIQNVAAVGRSFSPESKGDEFANLVWDADLQRLVGRWVEADIKFRSSICIKDFEVYLVDENIETISSFAMQDKKQRDVMVWLEHEMSQLGADFSRINLAYPYDIPEYTTAKGEEFHVDDISACHELSRLYHNTALILKEILEKESNVSDVKCWPHHFDLAATITRLDTGDPETSRSIGVGMSPGDQYYAEPYFYVSPWPYPMNDLIDLSSLGAHWHQEDWVGAVLPISKMVGDNLIQDQRKKVFNFYHTSIEFLKELL
jgi:hypothetical protein